MKRAVMILMVLAMSMMFVVPSFANGHKPAPTILTDTTTNITNNNITNNYETTEVTNVSNQDVIGLENMEAGLEVNAKLVKFTDNINLGVRANKNFYKTNMSEGYEAYAVVNVDLTK